MDLTHIILTLVTGLVLFLFAMNYLSDHLKALAGDQMKAFLDRFTNNLLTGIVSGTLVTALLDSSSAVIIMTIALVNARALTFRQAMSVVMGANIGTTLSSQIIAFDVGEYAAFPILVGFVISLVGRNEKARNAGKVLFGMGLIFFGLYTMEQAVEPLQESASFKNWMLSLENPLSGAAVGGLVTLIVQSSSATVGMVVGLGAQKLISLSAAIAVMFGSEVGTCADTLLASAGRSRQAIKTGLFHLLFNTITILLGLLLIHPFTELVLVLSAGAPLPRQIANAHMLFNVLGVLLFIPITTPLGRLMDRLVSNQPHERTTAPV